jgi:hypothetical protein
MHCLECAQHGAKRDAVALCHCCSAALCLDHAVVVPKRLAHLTPVCKTEELPLLAREFLCEICKAALDQPHMPVTD